MNKLAKSTAVGLVIIIISCQHNGTSNQPQNESSVSKNDKENLINKSDDTSSQSDVNMVIGKDDYSNSTTNKTSDTISITQKLIDALVKRKAYNIIGSDDNNNGTSLNDIHSILNQRKAETFTISNATDTVIIGKKGVMIYIPENAFDTKDGEKVVIKLEEYVDVSDMILSRMTTTSNGKLLESGGMINIKAMANDKELKLMPGKSLVVHLPKKNNSTDNATDITKNDKPMSVFYAVDNGNGINWIQDKSSISLIYADDLKMICNQRSLYLRYTNKTIDLVDHFNAYFPRDTEIVSFIKKHPITVIYSIDADGHCIVSKIKYDFLNGVNTKAISEDYTSKIKDFFYNIPLLNPTQDKKKIFDVAIRYGQVPRYANNKEYNAAFEKKYFAGKTYDETELDSYILSVTQMGMINCDRYPDINTPKIYFTVNPGNQYKTEMMLILKDYKSISSSYNINNQNYVFDNIPKDLNIKILIIQYRNDQTYYALKDSNTSKIRENNFDYKPMTVAALKTELERLN